MESGPPQSLDGVAGSAGDGNIMTASGSATTATPTPPAYAQNTQRMLPLPGMML